MREKGVIPVKKYLLNLKMMLEGGQSFRWKKTGDSSWTGVMGGLVWHLQQDDKSLTYEAFRDGPQKPEDNEIEEKLKLYLRLDAPLEEYYQEWSKCDKHFASITENCYGIRLLRQDPVETLFSFICSSNNSIGRISKMVEQICKLYGEPLSQEHYDFPPIKKLTGDNVEMELRKAGLGYRSKYIQRSAKLLLDFGGSSWLTSLSKGTYADAKNSLIKLDGIGSKVADCICLMALGFTEAVPVDTHVYQIAVKWYMPDFSRKRKDSLNSGEQQIIQQQFREIFGPLAGWAQTARAFKFLSILSIGVVL